MTLEFTQKRRLLTMHLFKTRCDFTFLRRGDPPHPDRILPRFDKE